MSFQEGEAFAKEKGMIFQEISTKSENLIENMERILEPLIREFQEFQLKNPNDCKESIPKARKKNKCCKIF